jgi:membrane protease YdiL (CAAX protease family)
MLGRLVDRVILEQLRQVDRDWVDESRTSDGRILAVVYSSCIALLLLNYVVLDFDVQRAAAQRLIDLVGLFGGNPAAIRPDQMALTMRITWALGCMFFYLGTPLLVMKGFLKTPLSSLGISPRGFFRHLWIYALLFLPVAVSVWVVSYQQGFQSTYPFYKHPASVWHLLCWELFYGLQFFSLEVFFRGFMLSELRHRWGWRSVLFMVTPYCMIHFSKPGLEATGAILAGSVLGVLALRTRTIWGGVAIHVAVAWWMDIASLIQKGWFSQPV